MKYSTDQNINNPTSFNKLELHNLADASQYRKIRYVTQIYYDRIADPDPFTCYIITDSNDNRFYYGTQLVLPDKSINYYIGINPENDKQFNICHLEDGNMKLISTWNDIIKADKELRRLITEGLPFTAHNRIYITMSNYIDNIININQLLFGIIIDLSIDKNNPELNDLISYINSVTDVRSRKLRNNEVRLIHQLGTKYPSSLFNLLNRLLSVIIQHDYFNEVTKNRRPSYEDGEPYDLSNIIIDIINQYTTWRSLQI